MFNTINNLTQFTNMISAKSNFQFLLGYMLQLNHLFLYNFHNHNYTSTTCIILAEIKYFDDQKGFLLDNYIYPYIHFNITKISMSFNRKIKYLTYTQKLIIPYRER